MSAAGIIDLPERLNRYLNQLDPDTEELIAEAITEGEAAIQRWRRFLDVSKSGSDPGNCYQNAARFILRWENFEGSPVVLCHGQVRHPETGRYHGHAWLEWGDGSGMVLDPSTGTTEAALFAISSYYQDGGIDAEQVQRYSGMEANERMLRTRTYGPWQD